MHTLYMLSTVNIVHTKLYISTTVEGLDESHSLENFTVPAIKFAYSKLFPYIFENVRLP